MKTLEQFELVYHGVEHEQYFQGCGTSFTSYDHCVTGIGASWNEALSDALDMICQGHDNLDVDSVCDRVTEALLSEMEQAGEDPDRWLIDETDDYDTHVYLSIRYKLDDV